MIDRGRDLHDLGGDCFARFGDELARRLVHRLHELGLEVDVRAA